MVDHATLYLRALKAEFAVTGVMPENKHGTTYGPRVYKCTCTKCVPTRWRMNASSKAAMANRRASEPIPHGTINGYASFECRCPECKNAARLYQAERRAKQKEQVR